MNKENKKHIKSERINLLLFLSTIGSVIPIGTNINMFCRTDIKISLFRFSASLPDTHIIAKPVPSLRNSFVHKDLKRERNCLCFSFPPSW